MTLMQGRGPVDGAVLRRMGACAKVAAVDLTLSAPKSVSVLFGIADVSELVDLGQRCSRSSVPAA